MQWDNAISFLAGNAAGPASMYIFGLVQKSWTLFWKLNKFLLEFWNDGACSVGMPH